MLRRLQRPSEVPANDAMQLFYQASLFLAVPRKRAARRIADGAACGAWMHLRLWRQTQGSRACRHSPRLAFGDRQQPVEPFQAAINPRPFRLELSDLHFKQPRAADVPAKCDQDRMCCPREPVIWERADNITPDCRLRVGQFGWRWRGHASSGVDDDGRQFRRRYPAAFSHGLHLKKWTFMMLTLSRGPLKAPALDYPPSPPRGALS